MKKFLLAILLVPTMLFAADQALTFNVQGHCKSCKKRVEKAASSVDGVKDATWNMKTKVFTVTIDDTKTSADVVKASILKTGHDVDTLKATDASYAKLPECCQYRDNN
ncbi:MAG: heavy-metal-associated domain-containing protein [bacterium]|nr:heavy-metal-associated domain-containing protein [bacterium]